LQRSDYLALVDGDIGQAATAAKGGIDAISRSLAMEYAKQGIRVNVVSPDS
jgi:NAD(P)-dependent dehydrogenase (short-subunit alcohol dehydrogenase family)